MKTESEILIHPDELTVKRIESCAALSVDTLGIHPTGGKTAKDSLAALVELTKTEHFRSLIDYAHSLGIKIEYEMHAASFLLDRKLFTSHPEYFREDEDHNRNPDVNLCVSNQYALKIIEKESEKLARALYGSSDRFYFWLDDIRKKKCNCEKCRELSLSDQQLIFQNAVLRGVRRAIPNAKVAYLAYTDCIYVPTKVVPDEGIFLEYAPFEKYVSKQNAELVKKERELILPLLSFFGNNDAKVLEYWLDNSLFSGWKKPPVKFEADREAILYDVCDYKRIGFEYISTFACFLGDDYEALYGEADISPFTDSLK